MFPKHLKYLVAALTFATGVRADLVTGQTIQFQSTDFNSANVATKPIAINGPGTGNQTPVWDFYGMATGGGTAVFSWPEEANYSQYITWRVAAPSGMIISRIRISFDRIGLLGSLRPGGDDKLVFEWSADGVNWKNMSYWENRPMDSTGWEYYDGIVLSATIMQLSTDVLIRVRKEEGTIQNDSGWFVMFSSYPYGGTHPNSFVEVTAVEGAYVSNNTFYLRPEKVEDTYSADDVALFHRLAASVGWDFAPIGSIYDRLSNIGVRYIRMINSDRLPGSFNGAGTTFTIDPGEGTTGTQWFRFIDGLEISEETGANPHLVIGLSVPEELDADTEGWEPPPGSHYGLIPTVHYWNGDWGRLRAYWKAIFHYVMVTKGFTQARFEVGNEPDGIGQFLATTDMTEEVEPGSEELYGFYFEVYENVIQAAAEFEASNPGLNVKIGGPALAWPYTFGNGEMNWADRFIKDTATLDLEPDFLGIHFYGNSAGLRWPRSSTDGPSFVSMFNQTKSSRDRYLPGVPIIVTEWGPSFHNDDQPAAHVNGNHYGSGWMADFIKVMAESGVEEGIFLTATDYVDKWVYPAWFVNYNSFSGNAWPKATFHPIQMFSALQGDRIRLHGPGGGADGVATSSDGGNFLQAIVWNFAGYIQYNGPDVPSSDRTVYIRVDGAPALYPTASTVHVRVWRVSETESNAYHLFNTLSLVDNRSELALVADTTIPISQLGYPGYSLSLPTSSVALVTLEID